MGADPPRIDLCDLRQGGQLLGARLGKRLAEIGGKDHATVLHACTTVNDLMTTDKTFKQYVTDIEKILVPVRR